MPSIKAIGMRMKSVLSTAKITKAMKMVAASKLKGAERMMLQARPFASSINGLMESKLTPGEDDAPTENPLLLAISSDKVRHVQCTAWHVHGVVCVAWCVWYVHDMRGKWVVCAWRVYSPMLALSSDQGLCGGINTRVSKEVKLALDAAGETKPKVGAPRGGRANTRPRPRPRLHPRPPSPLPPPPPLPLSANMHKTNRNKVEVTRMQQATPSSCAESEHPPYLKH